MSRIFSKQHNILTYTLKVIRSEDIFKNIFHYFTCSEERNISGKMEFYVSKVLILFTLSVVTPAIAQSFYSKPWLNFAFQQYLKRTFLLWTASISGRQGIFLYADDDTFSGGKFYSQKVDLPYLKKILSESSTNNRKALEDSYDLFKVLEDRCGKIEWKS